MLTLTLPRRAWQPLSAGPGAKGMRVYDWTLTDIPAETAGQWWLLVRRHRHTGKRAYYRCFSPAPVPLTTLVRVAGTRWAVEEDFQTGKELTGLDQHQVRTWTSWHRWATLTLLAHAFLTVTAAVEHGRAPAPADQIPSPATRSATSSPSSCSHRSGLCAIGCTGPPGADATNT